MKRTAYSPHIGIYVQGLKTDIKNNMSVQHYHDAYEIYFQTKGRRYIFFDNSRHTLERGDVVIFKPFELHYAQSGDCEYYERYVVNFSKESFSGILSNSEIYMLFEKIDSGKIHLDKEKSMKLENLFLLAQGNSRKKGFLSDKLLAGAVLQIIMCVLGESSEIQDGEYIDPQIAQAIRYIEKNYSKSMSLDEIADSVGLSKYYFSRRFKEITGASAIEYLNNIRLTKAHNLLINTENTLDETARLTGFSNTENLSRLFKKKYGMSPIKFKKSNKQQVFM